MLDAIFRRKTGFLFLIFILCGTGALLLSQLPIQLYPQTQRPRVRARINHTGISSIDFADEYADDIESVLLSIEGVEFLEVEYENDSSFFTLTFDWDTDSEKAKSDVESAMNEISNLLPAEYRDQGWVRFFSGENAGYLMMGITSRTASPEEIYRILKTSIEPSLNRIEDAELVEIYSVEDLSATVTLRQMDMLAYGLTILDVEQAMISGYRPESVGRLSHGETEYSIRFKRGVDSIYEFGRIIVAERGNLLIRLQDVADIDVSYALPSRTFIMDGTKGVRITATPIDGGNVRQMSEDIMTVLEDARIEDILPEDTVFHLYLDPAEYIDRSIQNVATAALLGAMFAMLIVLLTLGELRNTLLIGISLPITLVLSFILLYFFDVSINLISLGGIALAVGMVIDSSIVVMENIHRFRFEEAPIKDNIQLKDLIIRAVKQVRAPVIASTLTSILVFLPISFTAPLTNAILGDQARAVVFALAISLVVALTAVPLVAFLIYKVRKERTRAGTPQEAGSQPPETQQSEAHQPAIPQLRGLERLSVPVMGFFRDLYKTILRGIISRKWAAALFVLISFGILAFAVLRVLPLIPREIIAAPSSDRIVIFFRSSIFYDRDYIIEEKLPVMEQQIEEAVGEYVARTYADVIGRFNIFFINLTTTEVAETALGELQRIFVSDNTWYYNVMMWDPAQLPLPRTNDLQISVHGEDPAESIAILEQVRDTVNDTELYGRVYTDPGTSFSDEITMTLRTEVLQGFPNFSESGLLRLVRKVLGGTIPVEFEEESTTIPVSAEYPESEIAGREALENFLIPYNQGTVPLKHFFDFQESTGVAGIASENGERIFRLYARMVSGTPAARRLEYEGLVKDKLANELVLPAGYSIAFDNPQEEMDRAIESLFISLAASIVLIYLLLAFQFDSMSIPLVILVTVPLGFIGVIFSLFVFESTLSLNSLLGTILLGGIVVNNAIIMIDFYLQILPNFSNRIDALVETAGLRFAPIVITMLTTICGMLPLAIGLGEGSNIVQPLGIAVSGGLLISTVFTLFVVPSILSFMNLKTVSEKVTAHNASHEIAGPEYTTS